MLRIKYLGHYGFLLSAENFQLVIDPCFVSDHADSQSIEAFLSLSKSSGHSRIKKKIDINNLHLSALLLSHHRAENSRRQDVESILIKNPKIRIFSPHLLKKFRNEDYEWIINSKFSSHDFIFYESDFTEQVGPFQVQGLSNTVPGHFALYVKSKYGSFLHIANSKANRVTWDRRLDPAWIKFANLNPSLMTINMRVFSKVFVTQNDEMVIEENHFFTPVECANLCNQIRPSMVGLMESESTNFQANNREYFRNNDDNDMSHFKWAVNHLNPEIQTMRLSIGAEFEIFDGKPIRSTH